MSSDAMGGDLERAERMRKYKEERRKHLQAQGPLPKRSQRIQSAKVSASTAAGSSADEGNALAPAPRVSASSSSPPRVRTTRTSRLRAAATTADSSTSRERKNSEKSKTAAVSSAASVPTAGGSALVGSTSDSARVSDGDLECEGADAVIPLCDSLSDKMTASSGSASSRGNSRTRQPAMAPSVGPPSQKGPTFKQPTRPPSTKNDQAETTRRGRFASPGFGGKSDSDTIKDTNTKRAPPQGLFKNTASPVTKRDSPRSFTSSRSSSHSPLSSPSVFKIQPKKTVEVSKSLSRSSPGSLLNRISSESGSVQKLIPNACNSDNLKKLDTRITCDKRTKTVEDERTENKITKSATADAEQSRIKKRLNPRISDTLQQNGGGRKERELRSPKSEEKTRNMTPGYDKDFRPNVFKPVDVDNKIPTNTSSVDSRTSKIDKIRCTNTSLSNRMDALAALTKETLARVDKLAKKTRESPDIANSSSSNVSNSNKKSLSSHKETVNNRTDFKNKDSNNSEVLKTPAPSTSRGVSERLNDIDTVTQHLLDFEKRNSNSPLNDQNVTLRKHNEPLSSLLTYTPVSILKRKSSQEEHGASNISNGMVSTPPVTFSPSVVDRIPSKSRRHGQGILKKRRSLDESQVNRHRSCSPEVAFADDCNLDTRPILKTQRRSSLEEIIRGRSPDGQIQGILKRKSSRDGELLIEDQPLESPEPQGILKRKSNSSSSSSTTSSHVSIAQAVILAAAGGAELVDDKDAVRPILKKKSFSEERPCFDTSNGDIPRPILKKKSLTESDDNDHEKPKKPILKSARKISQEDGNTSSFDLSEDDRGSRRSSMLKHRTPEGSECESSYRPILKQRGSSQSREHSQSPRPRLSFCSDDERAPQFADDNNGTVQHFINPSFSILRRLEANAASAAEESDSLRPSKFEASRLQSPSKLKEFSESESAQNQSFPSVVLRRRDLRPRVAGRSNSLACNFSEELDQILKHRRNHIDENCPDDNPAPRSSVESFLENASPAVPKARPQFPSVLERIKSMEKYFGAERSGLNKTTGAVPKKQLRQAGRYKTQPVTVEELQNISRLEVGQVDFQRLTAASTSSALPSSDNSSSYSSLENSLRAEGSLTQARTRGEASVLSPDLNPSWISSKFQNYARSPGYGTGSSPSNNFDFALNNRYLDSDLLRSPERVKAFENVTASAGSPEYRPASSDFEERSPDHPKSSDNSESNPRSPRRNFLTPSETPLSPERRNILAEIEAAQRTPDPTRVAAVSNFEDISCWPARNFERRNSSNSSIDSTPETLRNRVVENLRRDESGHFDNIAEISYEDQKDSPTTREFNKIFRETATRESTNFGSHDFNKLDWDQTSIPNDSFGSSSNLPATASGHFEPALSFGEFVPPRKLEGSIDDRVQVKVERPKSLFQTETGYQKGSREATLQELDQLEGELEDVRAALDVDSSALCGVDTDHWSLNVSVDSGVFNRMSSGDSGPLSEELSLPQDFSKQPDIVKDSQPQQDKPPPLSDDRLQSKLFREVKSPSVEKTQDNEVVDMGIGCIKTSKQKPPTGLTEQKQEVYRKLENQEMEGSPDDDPIDSPQQLFGLMKSNSVSARASMWQQLQQKANKAAVKPVLRHSRSSAKDGSSVLDRFKTQPITLGEVTDAANEVAPNPLNQSRSSFNLSLEQDEDAKLDENDPAKLTLAEKMKLFSVSGPPRPPMGNKKPRSPRFQTMPVLASQVDDAKLLNLKQGINLNDSTADILSPKNKMIRLSLPGDTLDAADKKNVIGDSKMKMVTKMGSEDSKNTELGMNFRMAQNKLAEQASRMLTSEVKGILKSRSGAIPLLPSAVEAKVKTLPDKKTTVPPVPKAKSDLDKNSQTIGKSLTKGESSEGLKDEGIDSSSDEASASGSSHSSDDSCSTSETSEESEDEVDHEKSPEPTLVKPSQLKNSRTESDIARVAKDNTKSDGRIKLPCMDEMKARKIMERCMSKTEKDLPKTRVPIVPKKVLPGSEIPKENPLSPNAIRMKNLKNGSFALGKSLDSKNMAEITNNRLNIANSNVLPADKNENVVQTPWGRKLIPPVSKSQSVHMFNASLASRLRNGKNDKKQGEGSESDGESSGGREVRKITKQRRAFRGPPSTGTQIAPSEPPGLRRSATQPMAAQALSQHCSGGIAERLAALQQSGNNEWRKRVARISPDQDVITATKNKINETLSQQADDKRIATELDSTVLTGDLLISDRRNKLETSAQGWRKRVGPHDATLFSVAGRMGKDSPSLPSVLASSPLAPALVTTAQEKKTPQANRFRSRRAEGMSAGLMKSISTAAVSQPVSPKKPGIGDFKRSISVSGVDDMATDNSVGDNMTKSDGGRVAPSVPVPRADDETFTSFFTSASQTMVDSPASNFIPYNNNNTEQIAEDIDLDAIDSGARQLLSVTGVNRVRATRRAGGSRNPLRALAARTDLRQEYTEPPATGVADKEAARLRKDKIAVNSPMAVEALAGLASREDFTAVHLKKTASGVFPLGVAGSGGDAGSILLIHVKGRRRVQVRLVEPVANSVNSGDCFVLVTPDQVFNYIGLYSNVIERSRASDIALHIHTKKDLGCVNSTSIITLDEQVKHRSPRQWKQFWNLLGVENDVEDFVPTPAGNADEDEIFETGIMSTNMCYEVSDDELVPIQEYWGQTPKIAMLDPSKILVFDFGSELYVWNGKNTILENRRRAFQLAQELWDEGYDYKDCHICPLNIHQVLGARQEFKETSQKDTERPPWTMITKVTQHMETILFKEKFLDWPDFTRVIRVKEEEDSFKGAAEIKPCNVDVMWNREYEDPSLVLEGSHVGRGTHYYDKETMRHFEVKTKSVTKWIIQEYDYVKIDPEDLNEFYSGDSYIIRWEYQITVTGRELNGKPSKHNLTGRDRCAYFCWQGKDATANEKGAAALLTVELDHEKGPQVRVTQSCEPLAFLNLFKGSLVIHRGKKGLEKSKHRLYAVRGNIESESHLVQVACSMRQLRSRASMIIVESETGKIYVWHGVKSLKHTRAIALEAAKKMALKKNSELFDSNVSEVEVTEVKEDDEPKSVIDILGGANRELYHSLVNKQNKTEEMEVATTPRLFHFTDLSGQFDAIEVLSPLRHESLVTAYPFSQQELYSASQPGLYLLDCGDRLWLWQGWWPQQEDSESIETGSGTQRWQACRRAAMETVLEYWKLSRPSAAVARAYLAVAGLEPLPFTNMFDDWRDRDDIAELNIAYGHKVAEGETSVAVELCRLSRTSFPLAVLRQRPLPEAVDPAHIEKYLIADEFQETFNMTKEEFYELPAWKQANIKRDLGLF